MEGGIKGLGGVRRFGIGLTELLKQSMMNVDIEFMTFSASLEAMMIQHVNVSMMESFTAKTPFFDFSSFFLSVISRKLLNLSFLSPPVITSKVEET